MKLFHSLFFLRNFSSITDRLAIFLAIVGGLTTIAVIIIKLSMKPLERTLEKIKSNTEVSGEERSESRKIIINLSVIIIAVNAGGFFIGPLIQSMTGIGSGKYTLLQAAFTVFYNVSIGLLASIIQISWVNIATMPAKKALRYYYKDNRKKGLSLQNRNMLSSLACTLFAASITAGAGLGFISDAIRRQAEGTTLVSSESYAAQICIVIIFILGIIFFVQRTTSIELSKQIKYLGRSLEKTISGKENLTKRLSIIQFDELGDLVHFINKYMDYLQNLVEDIKDSASKVSSSCENIGTTAHQVSENVNNMIKTSTTVSDTASIQTKEVANAEQMINELSKSIQEGSVSVNDSLLVIKEIESVSRNVESFIGVISKIAAQTNLLTMNAAIEAAHAGDSGRGFAVVADEVRNLAEESSKGAKKITAEINIMLGSIAKGVEKSEHMKKAFDKITIDVEQTSNIIHSVSAAMEEQQVAASEILLSINALIEATNHIKKASADQNEKSALMHEAMTRVTKASESIENIMEQQNNSNNEISRVVDQLKGIAVENKDVVLSLERNLYTFNQKN